MTMPIATGSVHYLTLTVTDVARSVEFYIWTTWLSEVYEFGSARC